MPTGPPCADPTSTMTARPPSRSVWRMPASFFNYLAGKCRDAKHFLVETLPTKVKQLFAKFKNTTFGRITVDGCSLLSKLFVKLKETPIARAATSCIHASFMEVKDFFTTPYSTSRKFPEMLKLGFLVMSSFAFKALIILSIGKPVIVYTLLTTVFCRTICNWLPGAYAKLVGGVTFVLGGKHLLKWALVAYPLLPFVAFASLGPEQQIAILRETESTGAPETFSMVLELTYEAYYRAANVQQVVKERTGFDVRNTVVGKPMKPFALERLTTMSARPDHFRKVNA